MIDALVLAGFNGCCRHLWGELPAGVSAYHGLCYMDHLLRRHDIFSAKKRR